MTEVPEYSNSIFWIDVDKIQPNPYQPRRQFDEVSLASLSESIKQYGVLQPLVVIRKEIVRPDGGISAEYELLAGERRLRASKLAGVSQVPVVIRSEGESSKAKLEIAIVENIQREDLNPIDRARAFQQLVSEFDLKHHEVAGKVGKSREYVSNSIRLLALSDEMIRAIEERKISEGHARPLLMLVDRPQDQMNLYNEILDRKITVREAENISRRIATDRTRKNTPQDQETFELENKLAERLGTRVHIEKKEKGGKITIDYFSPEDLLNISRIIDPLSAADVPGIENIVRKETVDDTSEEDTTEEDEDIYTISNFSL